MKGYEVTTTWLGDTMTAYYCTGCGEPATSMSAPERHVRGPIALPADAVCARCLHTATSREQAQG